MPGVPTAERLRKGPVAVIECNQEIPCNPCKAACPRGGIKVETLHSLPQLDENKCTGCGSCIAPCPGLAIFVVDATYSKKEAMVSIPYEFQPIPKPLEEVLILDRGGRKICKGKILKVRNSRRDDHTAVVSFAVPRKYAMDARAFIPLVFEE